MLPDDEEPYDANQLPWFSAFGEPAVRVLHVSELDSWARLRRDQCKHTALRESCKWCQGTIKAADAFGQGNTRVRIYPRV